MDQKTTRREQQQRRNRSFKNLRKSWYSLKRKDQKLNVYRTEQHRELETLFQNIKHPNFKKKEEVLEHST